MTDRIGLIFGIKGTIYEKSITTNHCIYAPNIINSL